MRKADLRKNHKWFEAVIRRYEDSMNRLLSAKRVVRQQDKKDIAEATLLKLCAYWESFVDHELLDCVNIDSSKLRDHLDARLPRNLNRELCRAILFGDGYLDFKSVGALKGYAKKILPKKTNPFRLIDDPSSRKIDEFFIIRNYLSHYSFAAKRSLTRMYRKNYKMRYFREPGTFLFARNGKRLVTYIESLKKASRQMEGII